MLQDCPQHFVGKLAEGIQVLPQCAREEQGLLWNDRDPLPEIVQPEFSGGHGRAGVAGAEQDVAVGLGEAEEGRDDRGFAGASPPGDADLMGIELPGWLSLSSTGSIPFLLPRC